MKENCEFCNNEYSETVIAEYSNWSLELSLNQLYLGKTIIKLKRHAEDINDLNKTERKELFEKVLPETEKSLNTLFSPDTFNYSYIGMSCRHFHIHAIPRYKSAREFDGKIFEDENWGGHYKTENTRKMKPNNETFNKIKTKIREELEK